MARTAVADVMTRRVVCLPGATMLDEAAQAMRDQSIGDMVVTDGPTMSGLVTDRDIAVRAMRERDVRRLLVCDADRKLVGIISLSDLALLPGSTAA
ncbi:CBS domain-containing protein [Actinoplanes sp. NPDC049599]|uniref:CBS domain-containing protein n=1 Tax=Actinoplanes sp. NPDC049599 TaxID=3363903 RepID=UPI00379299FB